MFELYDVQCERSRWWVSRRTSTRRTTFEEQQAIVEQLREIKESVKKTHTLSEQRSRELEARFSYLEDVSRLGRMDWRQVLLATMFQMFLTAVLEADAVRDIIYKLDHAWHLFGFPFPGLPGG